VFIRGETCFSWAKYRTATSEIANITLGNITTDAKGNASADVGTIQPAGWSIFRVSDASGVQFVTAFRVQ